MQKKASFLMYREPISGEFGRIIKNGMILKSELIKNNFKNIMQNQLYLKKKKSNNIYQGTQND